MYYQNYSHIKKYFKALIEKSLENDDAWGYCDFFYKEIVDCSGCPFHFKNDKEGCCHLSSKILLTRKNILPYMVKHWPSLLLEEKENSK